MQFNNIQVLAQKNEKKLQKKLQQVIHSGIFLNGIQNEELENNLLQYFGRGYVTAVASGHDALLLALQSLNLQKNDEIILPVNSYPTAFPAALSGASLVPVDCDSNGHIAIPKILKAITSRTKVIIIVHLYGLIGDIEAIQTICKRNNIVLIEDCAQSFGTFYKNKPAGTFGDISCFSFYPTKNIGTLGDGGALWTKHKSFNKFFQQAKAYGENIRYQSEFIAGHSRMPEIQAAIINSYFKDFSKEQKRRQAVYTLYKKYLSNNALTPFVRILSSDDASNPLPNLFVISCEKRDALKHYLHEKKIPTMIHYPSPVHLVKAFKFLGYEKGDFPCSEYLSNHVLSLPFHSSLTREEIAYIAQSMHTFYYD